MRMTDRLLTEKVMGEKSSKPIHEDHQAIVKQVPGHAQVILGVRRKEIPGK